MMHPCLISNGRAGAWDRNEVLFVTLVVTVNGPETIWLLADRRLSRKGQPPKDDGCKVMVLETTDGIAILGYAGLGATIHGTEPADWMSAVLRGRNIPLEQSLGVLAEAMRKQFPRHMLAMPSAGGGPAHSVLVPAFLGDEARLYTIDIALTPDRKRYAFRYTRHVVDKPPRKPRTPRLAIAGSGAQYLIKDKKWMRSLLRLVNAYAPRKQVGAHAVADHLPKLNYDVYRQVSDKSVGPRCIVAWRNKKVGLHKGGGGHQAYVGTTRADTPLIPTVGAGMAVHEIIGTMMPHMTEMFEAMRAGQPAKEPDWADDFARLADKPDENLR
jgi:hypothetical protein